ncbi:hypothetical protein ACFLV7_05500 [Chloroflexota bacterium]
MYFGFGGGGDECYPFEINQAGAIEWNEYTYYNSEGIPITNQRLVWCACGLGAGGADANFTLPDGEIQPLVLQELTGAWMDDLVAAHFSKILRW